MDVSGGNVTFLWLDRTRAATHRADQGATLGRMRKPCGKPSMGSPLCMAAVNFSWKARVGPPAHRPTPQEVKSLEVLQEAPKKPHHHLSSL